MCHPDSSRFFSPAPKPRLLEREVAALCFGDERETRKIAILPDIYGDTPFYRQLSAYFAGGGAQVCFVNPWHSHGELPEPPRAAAYERRHKLRDGEFCRRLYRFLAEQGIDAVVGFCIGGNFVLELNRLGFTGTSCAVYPLPWGMPNQDALEPGFDFMPNLATGVTIIMGREDALAGPGNIARLEQVCGANPRLELHMYDKSGHGFLKDLGGENAFLRNNAADALELLTGKLFPGLKAASRPYP